ncbi:zinc C3HC4 type RING finger protein [Babesia ovis]|uniref:Zinc C3HC4 type RING finger protein n=1 Tax=Babesia ovis TaxID=5869 RepID=A0A9W5T805_BABOV|nr:zinc C3HC4 type RING finger protein [Babesia ovis]
MGNTKLRTTKTAVVKESTPSAALQRMYRGESGRLILCYVKDKKALDGLADFVNKHNVKTVKFIEPSYASIFTHLLQELALVKNKVEVLHIDLWSNGAPELVELIGNALAANKDSLVELSLKCRFTSKFLASLLPLLPTNIEVLDLSENILSDIAFLQPLLDYIKCSDLHFLKLSNCSLRGNILNDFVKRLLSITTPLSLDALDGLDLSACEEIPKNIRQTLRDPPVKTRKEQMGYANIGIQPHRSCNVQLLDYLKSSLLMRRLVGSRVRVWWPASSDEQRGSFAGRFWPAKVLRVNPIDMVFVVEYDNQEVDHIPCKYIQPESAFLYGGGLNKNFLPSLFGSNYFKNLSNELKLVHSLDVLELESTPSSDGNVETSSTKSESDKPKRYVSKSANTKRPLSKTDNSTRSAAKPAKPTSAINAGNPTTSVLTTVNASVLPSHIPQTHYHPDFHGIVPCGPPSIILPQPTNLWPVHITNRINFVPTANMLYSMLNSSPKSHHIVGPTSYVVLNDDRIYQTPTTTKRSTHPHKRQTISLNSYNLSTPLNKMVKSEGYVTGDSLYQLVPSAGHPPAPLYLSTMPGYSIMQTVPTQIYHMEEESADDMSETVEEKVESDPKHEMCRDLEFTPKMLKELLQSCHRRNYDPVFPEDLSHIASQSIDNVETIKGLDVEYSGNLLEPGDICEYRDPLDSDGIDPSDYIVVIKEVNKVEPLYRVCYLYHDDDDEISVYSHSVRRLALMPWYLWVTLVMKLERQMLFSKGLSDPNVLEKTLADCLFCPQKVDLDSDFLENPPNPLEMQLQSLYERAFHVSESFLTHPRIRPKQEQELEVGDSIEGLRCQLGQQQQKLDALQKLYEDAQKQLEEERDLNARLQAKLHCVVCFEQRINCLLNPCGHFNFCSVCAESFTSCPICRGKIEDRKILSVD